MQSDSTLSIPSDTLGATEKSREHFWKEHVEQWRESGLSKAMYCQQHSLVYHQMVYWCSKAEKKKVKQVAPVSKGFVAVKLAPLSNPTGLSVRLPNGIAIQGIDERSVSLVGQLVKQL